MYVETRISNEPRLDFHVLELFLQEQVMLKLQITESLV